MASHPLLIVTGPPGAGKSTVAELVVERLERSVLVSGDAFHGFLRRDQIAPWLPESNDQNRVVVEAQAAATAAFVVGGFNVVFDGVIGPWFLPTFMAACGLDVVDYALLLPPIDTCLQRVATRVGHGFDDPVATRKMHDEFSRALSGYEGHVISASVGDADAVATADAVADARERCELRVGPVDTST